jgi:uncharacterized membrane protein YidH (DUF202 family)
MKKPRPPLELIAREKFLGNLKYWRKISKLWGFEGSGNSATYWRWQTYYGGSVSPGFHEFTRLTGLDKSIRHSTKGIKRAWLYLNRSKAERKLGRPNIQHPATIASNVNTRIRSAINQEVKVTNRRLDQGLFDTKSPPLELPVWFDRNNPTHTRQLFVEWVLARKGIVPHDEEEDPYQIVIATFSVLSDVLGATIEGPFASSFETVESYVVTVCDDRVCQTEVKARQVQLPCWAFRIRVPPNSVVFANSDPFIQRIYDNVEATLPEASQHPSMQGPTTPGDPVNEIWNGAYLRKSFLTYTGMKVVDKIEYFFAAIDNGYKKKKKKKGFKSFIGIIIAIVIVVVAVISGQWYAANAGFAIAATATVVTITVGIAITIVVAATIISLAIMVGNMLGLSEYMGALVAFSNMMAPLVRVAQVITVIYSIVNIVQQVAQQASQQAAQQAVQQGTQSATGQAASTVGQQAVQGVAKPTLQNYAKAAFNVAKEQVIGSGPKGSFGPEAIGKAMQAGNYVANKYYEAKNEKMVRELNKEATLLAQEQEFLEQYKTNHVLMDMIRAEPLLSAAAESQYANIYDRPYEWWSTPFHLGCMQANTVHALMYLDA